jgi:cell division protein FtsQ
MSSYYYPDVDKITEEKKPAGKLEKGIKRLLVIAVVILLLQLIWLFVISPFIPFSMIEIHGITELNRTEILALCGIDENSSYFSINTKDIQNILSGHILVESAVVIKRFPDKLSIFLTPREAAAVTLANVGSKQVPMFIDRQGVFFKIGQAQEASALPILSGIENPQLNMKLPNALIPLVDNLYKMGSSSPELLSAISEIRIERKAWDGYDLVLFPVHSPIRVRVEKDFSEDVLRYMLLMLNVFEEDNRKPREIDFRSGIGSYTIKELSS